LLLEEFSTDNKKRLANLIISLVHELEERKFKQRNIIAHKDSLYEVNVGQF
jgi:hypothetical protein